MRWQEAGERPDLAPKISRRARAALMLRAPMTVLAASLTVPPGAFAVVPLQAPAASAGGPAFERVAR